MLVETLFLALLIGMIMGGSIEKLSEMELKVIWLPLAAFFIEWLSGFLMGSDIQWLSQTVYAHTHSIEVAVYLLLVTFLILNRKEPGMVLLLVGTVMNALVIFANRGFMPVDPYMGIVFGFDETLEVYKAGQVFAHAIVKEQTQLFWLADRIVIPPPYPLPKTVSPGDLVLDVGLWWLILKYMLSGKHKTSQASGDLIELDQRKNKGATP